MINGIDGGVGKTSLIQRFNNPDPNLALSTTSTIGYEYCKKEVKMEEDIIQVHLWDTAGQDKFKSMIPTYFKKAAGCIWVYDITNENSFQGLDEWIAKLRELGDEDCLTMIAGNKLDQESKREVPESTGATYARK